MQKINLYRYTGVGGVIDTAILLDAPYELRYRILADEGMALTNGEVVVDVRDVDEDELELWAEIPKPAAEDGEAE